MYEKIGGVLLDSSLYPGEDFYSDGQVEDRLLQIAKTYSPTEFDKVILEQQDWAVLYHLSKARENIIRWLPLSQADTVLEIGSGCGAITGALAEMCQKVTCVELSKKRSLINAYRNQAYSNIEIKLGNFEAVHKNLQQKYDCITLIGVLEYAKMYLHNQENAPLAFLQTVRPLLNETGCLVLAIENKFGLKYWAGCKEDHTGEYFEGIQGYPAQHGVTTFSKQELQKLCEHAGFSVCKWYYPYPDYKFPIKIYSDDFLPQKGELKYNDRNFDNDRLSLFDESLVFNELIESDMFPFFSNSFLLVLRP